MHWQNERVVKKPLRVLSLQFFGGSKAHKYHLQCLEKPNSGFHTSRKEAAASVNLTLTEDDVQKERILEVHLLCAAPVIGQ